MAAAVGVTSLESAFRLTLQEGAGAGADAQRRVRVKKVLVADSAVARELLRDKETWYVTNHNCLVKLERADAILRLLEQLLLPALAVNPTSADLLRSLTRCCSKLANCVAEVGGSFVAVGNKLVIRMRKVRDLCANNPHASVELRAAVEGLIASVAAVRSTDVQLG